MSLQVSTLVSLFYGLFGCSTVVPDLYVTDPHKYGVLVFVALDSFSRSSSKALFL